MLWYNKLKGCGSGKIANWGVNMYDIKLQGDSRLVPLVEELKGELKKIYGEHLRSIILYGSYARGDYDPESDLDIMVLVNLDNAEQLGYRGTLIEKITDISIKYNILVSVIDNNYEDFNIRASYVPFYKNVAQEGIKVYAR
ncbi:MAG TPA: nucleotidyltransferase domain-containing protein [Clostridia bacterium]|nr:nucleotidyltransferase domain-containing protein [Clostridia bacterium]